MLTIELTRGSSWSEPVETIERRDCDTISIEFAAAEALHWLLEIQKNAPARGATHYRVIETGSGRYRRATLNICAWTAPF